MASLSNALYTTFDGGLSMVTTVATTIADEPILLLFALIPIVGLGVGLFKRLLNL